MEGDQNMPGLEKKHEFIGGIQQVFLAITSYEKYSKYIQGVTDVRVLPAVAPGSRCQVRYELNIIKKFFYVLDMYEEEPCKISWQLAESNLMKKNDGLWILEERSRDKTTASYSLDVAFRGLVPSSITKGVAKTSLPAMFEGMQRLIDEQ